MQRTRRPFIFAMLGLLICFVAVYLFYDHRQPRSTAPLPQKYTYQIKQSATSSAHYKQNTFFEANGSPGADNTAYVTGLTDYLNSQLNYSFAGSKVMDLKYSYSAIAVVRSKFAGKDLATNAANVWTKKYTLIKTVNGSSTTQLLKLNPAVKIPFEEYAATASKFRTVYNVPVSSEVAVTYTVKVRGQADGVPFTNTKSSTISVPLDQQLYKIAVKYDRTDSREVVSKQARQIQDVINRYEMLVASLLLLIGLGSIIYGLRKQIVKSPYQRELARIYRYNEGIIIKARRPVSLAHKTIVDLDSFDDLLSVEEETGSPIIANELSSTSTRFIITSDETAYVFTLGGTTPKEDWDDSSKSPQSPQSPSTKQLPKPTPQSAPKLKNKITITED